MTSHIKINREQQSRKKRTKKAKEIFKMESRTLESAFRVVSLAKLEPETLQPKSQAIRFSNDNSEESQLMLLEVTSKVADQLEEGQTFVFRGDTDDSVVLCSNNEVFDVKEAETSNSLLIVKNLLDNDKCQEIADDDTNAHEVTVNKTFYRYFELKLIMPNYQKLIRTLEQKSLNSFPVDDVFENSIAFHELLNSIQCSETGVYFFRNRTSFAHLF